MGPISLVIIHQTHAPKESFFHHQSRKTIDSRCEKKRRYWTLKNTGSTNDLFTRTHNETRSEPPAHSVKRKRDCRDLNEQVPLKTYSHSLAKRGGVSGSPSSHALWGLKACGNGTSWPRCRVGMDQRWQAMQASSRRRRRKRSRRNAELGKICKGVAGADWPWSCILKALGDPGQMGFCHFWGAYGCCQGLAIRRFNSSVWKGMTFLVEAARAHLLRCLIALWRYRSWGLDSWRKLNKKIPQRVDRVRLRDPMALWWVDGNLLQSTALTARFRGRMGGRDSEVLVCGACVEHEHPGSCCDIDVPNPKSWAREG